MVNIFGRFDLNQAYIIKNTFIKIFFLMVLV